MDKTKLKMILTLFICSALFNITACNMPLLDPKPTSFKVFETKISMTPLTIKVDQIRNSQGSTIKYEEGHVYYGKVNNDEQPHGNGKIEFADDEIISYEGNWSKSMPHGKGMLIWANGDIYEGNFKSGAMTGDGIMKFNDGTQHSGEFSKGVLVSGTITNPDGTTQTVEK